MTCQTTQPLQISSHTGGNASLRESIRHKDPSTLAPCRRESRNLYHLAKTEERSRLEKLEAKIPTRTMFRTYETMRERGG